MAWIEIYSRMIRQNRVRILLFTLAFLIQTILLYSLFQVRELVVQFSQMAHGFIPSTIVETSRPLTREELERVVDDSKDGNWIFGSLKRRETRFRMGDGWTPTRDVLFLGLQFPKEFELVLRQEGRTVKTHLVGYYGTDFFNVRSSDDLNVGTCFLMDGDRLLKLHAFPRGNVTRIYAAGELHDRMIDALYRQFAKYVDPRRSGVGWYQFSETGTDSLSNLYHKAFVLAYSRLLLAPRTERIPVFLSTRLRRQLNAYPEVLFDTTVELEAKCVPLRSMAALHWEPEWGPGANLVLMAYDDADRLFSWEGTFNTLFYYGKGPPPIDDELMETLGISLTRFQKEQLIPDFLVWKTRIVGVISMLIYVLVALPICLLPVWFVRFQRTWRESIFLLWCWSPAPLLFSVSVFLAFLIAQVFAVIGIFALLAWFNRLLMYFYLPVIAWDWQLHALVLVIGFVQSIGCAAVEFWHLRRSELEVVDAAPL